MSALTNIFSDIANALRSKMGVSDTYTPAQMAPAINNIPTGAQIDEYDYITKYSEGREFNNGIHAFRDANSPNYVIQYNDAVTIKEITSLTDASNYFKNGTNLESGRMYGNDSVFIFGDDITNMASSFENCNQITDINLLIGNSVTNMNSCFWFASNFNSFIKIPESVKQMAYCFKACSNFDKPINIPSGSTNIECLFDDCTKFNQPVSIPQNITSMFFLFGNCYEFNQPVVIPDKVSSIYGAFSGCNKFNQPLIIPEKTSQCSQLLYMCTNFNQPISFKPYTVEPHRDYLTMSTMLYKCTNFNQDITIPSPRVSLNVQQLLVNCINFGKNIYFENSTCVNNCERLFANCNRYKKKSIYCDNATPFISITNTKSIAGNSVTWLNLSDGNGYYNKTYNIYIYNNWTPT